MIRSSLLGSWIDVEAAAAAAETLCVPPPVVAVAADPWAAMGLSEAGVSWSGELPPPEGLASSSGMERPPDPPSAPAALGMVSNEVLVAAVPNEAFILGGSNEALGEEEPNEALGEEEPNEAPPPLLHGRLSALRARAERNGLVPVVVAVERPAFVVPLGSLPVRVRALADWINETFFPESLFVADDHGQSLVEFGGGAQLLAAASVLAEAAARARRHLPGQAGASMVHLALGAGQVLSLISISTVLGPWHAGLTTPSPLTEADALEMAVHLQATAAGV